jgi:KUP system potassium uptake protein
MKNKMWSVLLVLVSLLAVPTNMGIRGMTLISGSPVALEAMGVVYGDIGTSPLYTMNEIFFPLHGHGLSITPDNVKASVGFIFWSLLLLISIQYLAFVVVADHKGEGGVFALLALISGHKGRWYRVLGSGMILCAGLLYGDGIITPAISVLAAVEGLEVASPAFKPFVLPLTFLILTVLFAVQYRGTAAVGKLFGPVMFIWFAVIGALGMCQWWDNLEIFQAIDPRFPLRFMSENNLGTILKVLGSVMLSVTGGEALYADLGHFGRSPIRSGWYRMVYWCLLSCYFGQGAYLLSHAEVPGNNIFYALVPGYLLYPMVALATCATVIASQALITGAFSLTSQATSQGLLPRFLTIHTNAHHHGQIYIPTVNWALYGGCIALVFTFRSSLALAAAYGLAVSLLMCATSVAMREVAINIWRWHWLLASVVFGVFGAICGGFFLANSLKFIDGGYIPVAMGIVLYTVMTTWRWGRCQVSKAYKVFNTKTVDWLLQLFEALEAKEDLMRQDSSFADRILLGERQLDRLHRAMIFLVSRPVLSKEDTLPQSLRGFLKQYGALPSRMVLFSLKILDTAQLGNEQRYSVIELRHNVLSVNYRFGYMENPSIPDAIEHLKREGVIPNLHWMLECGGEDIIIARGINWMQRTRAKLFRWLHIGAIPAHRYFGLEHHVVATTILNVEVGGEIPRVDIPDFEISAS